MKPSELRAVAEKCDAHIGDGLPDCWVPHVCALTDYILANVHADDDEPVTVEWCDEIGLSNSSQSPYQRRYVIFHSLRLVAEACPGWFRECQLWVGSGVEFRKNEHTTRGQVRHLIAALKGGE